MQCTLGFCVPQVKDKLSHCGTPVGLSQSNCFWGRCSPLSALEKPLQNRCVVSSRMLHMVFLLLPTSPLTVLHNDPSPTQSPPFCPSSLPISCLSCFLETTPCKLNRHCYLPFRWVFVWFPLLNEALPIKVREPHAYSSFWGHMVSFLQGKNMGVEQNLLDRSDCGVIGA